MAGEAEINAVFNILKVGLIGRTVVDVRQQPATQKIEIEFDHGKVIRLPYGDGIVAIMEA